MRHEFTRSGDLKDLASYPMWLQQVVHETRREKARVVGHEVYALMRDAALSKAAMQRFLIGCWPTIEQFPQFMAMNLQKARYGRTSGDDMARRYLMHNIRVEQKHADHWVEWARSADLTLHDLQAADQVSAQALTHWCWYVCDRASLAVGIAATNFAIEGATGDWACLVCSRPTYADSLPASLRGSAMRWLRVHAEYDDVHPWEALDIVATLMGHSPERSEVEAVRRAICKSYAYMAMGLDHVLEAMLHGSFEETASNSSTLGALDVA
jgi:pyrroloquinoline quinone (PQQ) biosynthesis protein C